MQRANIVKGNFTSNYRNAIGSQDISLERDLIFDQLAELIKEKPLTIIQAMAEMGHPFRGNTTEELTQAVTDLLFKSPVFVGQIAILIGLNNGMIGYSDVTGYGQAKNDTGSSLSGDAAPATTIDQTTATGLIGIANSVNNAIATTTPDNTSTGGDSVKAALVTATGAKNASATLPVTPPATTGNSKGTIIFLLILCMLGVTAFMVYRKGKKEGKEESVVEELTMDGPPNAAE